MYSERAEGTEVTVKVNKVDSAVLFGEDYTNWTFSMTYSGPAQLPPAGGRLHDARGAICGRTPAGTTLKWLSIVNEAFSTVDDTKRNALITEAATMDFNEGGYIIPHLSKNQLDAYSSKLSGGFVTNDVMGI